MQSTRRLFVVKIVYVLTEPLVDNKNVKVNPAKGPCTMDELNERKVKLM
jgi:hypothetical protein